VILGGITPAMIAAGDAGVSVLGCIGMSHISSSHIGTGDFLSNGNELRRSVDKSHPSGNAEDSAIDKALCAVPLPDGLMTRLGMLAYTMPEDAPDQVDWLGC
jgi:hypothetical protein